MGVKAIARPRRARAVCALLTVVLLAWCVLSHRTFRVARVWSDPLEPGRELSPQVSSSSRSEPRVIIDVVGNEPAPGVSHRLPTYSHVFVISDRERKRLTFYRHAGEGGGWVRVRGNFDLMTGPAIKLPVPRRGERIGLVLRESRHNPGVWRVWWLDRDAFDAEVDKGMWPPQPETLPVWVPSPESN